jgi:hypothetical protein
MRKKENTDKLKGNDISFFQRISPLNKSLTIQIIFLTICIISASLALYYIFYQENIQIFIYEGILPNNLNWMLFFIGGSAFVLFVMLFAPLDEPFFIKRELVDKITLVLKNIDVKFSEELFNEAINIIESYFNELLANHIYKKNEKLLHVYKQALINKNFKILLKKINDLYNVNSLREFTQEIRSALILIENEDDYILESQKKKLKELSNRSKV